MLKIRQPDSSHNGSRSIRTQLLWSVNLTLGIAILCLLSFHYQKEMSGESRKKFENLRDEAIAIHTAVNHLALNHDSGEIQRYIDKVCNRICSGNPSGHRITVKVDGNVLHSHKHAEDALSIFEVISEAAVAPDHQAVIHDRAIVVGSHIENGISVFVSEDLADARRAIRTHLLTQLGILSILGIGAAVIVNIVLLRIVDHPLKRLVQRVEQIAVGEYGLRTKPFGCRELQNLFRAINSMSERLQFNERERHQQLEKAQRIQQHLLPDAVAVPGIRIAHSFKPADVVAGDYYDYLPLSDGSWLICLADVTGHGIPAAMGAAMLKSILLGVTEEEPIELISIVQKVNRRFAATVLPGNFASMFLAQWTPAKQEFSWVSAGHETGILLTERSTVQELSSTGLLLGIDEKANYKQQTITLAPNQRILLFSDGATETLSLSGELFGRERLLECFRRHREARIEFALAKIEEQLDSHRGTANLSDDLTLIAMEFAEMNESE